MFESVSLIEWLVVAVISNAMISTISTTSTYPTIARMRVPRPRRRAGLRCGSSAPLIGAQPIPGWSSGAISAESDGDEVNVEPYPDGGREPLDARPSRVRRSCLEPGDGGLRRSHPSGHDRPAQPRRLAPFRQLVKDCSPLPRLIQGGALSADGWVFAVARLPQGTHDVEGRPPSRRPTTHALNRPDVTLWADLGRYRACSSTQSRSDLLLTMGHSYHAVTWQDAMRLASRSGHVLGVIKRSEPI